MQPAIENEDTVLLNRIAYSFHGPKGTVLSPFIRMV